MRIFFILVKKEFKELLTRQLLIILGMMIFIFYVIGKTVGAHKKAADALNEIAVMDIDKSAVSKMIIDGLEGKRYKIIKEEPADIKETLLGGKYDRDIFLLVIPAGLGENLSKSKSHKIQIYAMFTKGFKSSELSSSKIRKTVSDITKNIGDFLIKKNFAGRDADFIKNPVSVEEFVAAGNAVEKIPISHVLAFVQSQSILFPIVIFLVVIYASQIVMTAVAGEKENKTLEILLSSPVNRKVLVFSKLTASGLIAFVLSGGYMLGMRSFMSGISGGALSSAMPDSTSASMAKLGLIISPFGYGLIGISVLFCILCALAMAIILGVLSDDVKSTQAAGTPLMMLLMLSYMLPMFMDISAASAPLKLVLLAIPFTHAFISPQNIMLGKNMSVIWGIIYQGLVFLVFVIAAARIFSGESILTLKLRFKKPA
ncbi:MAG: ABC transporter permease [Elusimicrobia bacterium]|nr:ABC transporter permease [Elusimicrobiota bacterium]